MKNWHLDLSGMPADQRAEMEKAHDVWSKITDMLEHLEQQKDDPVDASVIADLRRRGDAAHDQFRDIVAWYIYQK